MKRLSLFFLLPFLLLLPGPGGAADTKAESKDKAAKPKLNAGLLSSIKFRNLGPALMSGRIADIAIDPAHPNTWYVAVGSGNLWKTVNAGTTWRPIFDNYGAYSIGCVTIDPSHPHTIWVGTGEAVGGRHVGYGDGVYRSLDGGKTFKNLGLKASEHIAKIIVHPKNSDIVYVAAQGPLWSPGGERGLYQTTNGGRTWQVILHQGPYTGVTDVAMDPRDPKVLYAATHQRHRTVWTLINGGPESGIWKSTDGGKTWRELKQGLPGEDKGKIALAISPQRPDVIYASIELAGRKGGFWRSEDGGESWTKKSDYISGGTGPHYYQELWCDPYRFDTVYQANVRLGRTEDGGATWQTVARSTKHVDNHAVAFHPGDPDFLLVGCDGGLYRSRDRGRTYQFFANLPLTQFYKVDVDYDTPFYHLAGGTQDNATQYGPSRTRNNSGIRNSDWRVLIGGDGHDCAIDPEDPNIIYCESQQGYLRRFDRRTGESVSIRPRPRKGEPDLRFNWDSPILISPHRHTRIYFGSKQLHRSDDRGNSWTAISPDLSRGQDRYRLKVMDRVWSIDATHDTLAMSQYGNITSISESPRQEGLIYVGTDDGLIQVTEDGGKHWRRIDRIYGIPEQAFVNDIKADRHHADTVYAVFDNHKRGDFKPYLVKSTDRGHTWASITGDLPDRHIVWRFIQDHVKPDLFFLGTEFGIFCSLDGGTHWLKLKGNVPVIPFRDLEIQRRENDLVGASFGRSFFVLDDYSFLRELDESRLRREELSLFPIRKTLLYVPDRPLGGEKGSQGDAYFTAPNPPPGALITYYLRDSLQTRKQKRHQQEAKVKKQGGDNPYPGWEALKQEEREEKPVLAFTIRDAQGRVINRIAGDASAGLHRISWDLRQASRSAVGQPGRLAAPGTYTVSATKRVADKDVALGKPQSFEVVSIVRPTLPAPNPQQVAQFYDTAEELRRAVQGASGKLAETLEQLAAIKRAIPQAPKAEPKLLDQARALELQLLDLQETLNGDPVRRQYREPAPLSIGSRISYALATLGSTAGPTETQRQDYRIAREQFTEVSQQFKHLLNTRFAELQRQLEAAKVPWTPGRPMPQEQN